MSHQVKQHPVLPPIGHPKAFPGTRDTLLRIAAGCGLYLLLVMFPAYLWLSSTPLTAKAVAIGILASAAYAAYAFREMKRLTLIPSKQDDPS